MGTKVRRFSPVVEKVSYVMEVSYDLPCGELCSRHGARASCGGGVSFSRAQALGAQASVVPARGLESSGLVVVAHGLVVPRHVRSKFPGQGWNLCPLQWQAES